MVQIEIKLSGSETPEVVEIEIQGDLKTKNNQQLPGSFVGDLHYTKSGTPILIIGHHILYGKVMDMEKPLVLLKKHRIGDSLRKLTDTISPDSEGKNTKMEYLVSAVIRKKVIFKTRPKPIISNAT